MARGGINPALIRRMAAIGERLSRGVRTPVTHIHKTGNGEFGPVFADPVELTDESAPLVEAKDEEVATAQGMESVQRTKLSFFVPLAVDHADKFSVAGSEDVWQVVRIEGLKDPDGAYYMPVVWLGSAPAQN